MAPEDAPFDPVKGVFSFSRGPKSYLSADVAGPGTPTAEEIADVERQRQAAIPTLEDQRAARKAHGMVDPLQDLSAEDLAQLNIDRPEQFSIVQSFLDQPDLHKNPEIVQKVADAVTRVAARHETPALVMAGIPKILHPAVRVAEAAKEIPEAVKGIGNPIKAFGHMLKGLGENMAAFISATAASPAVGKIARSFAPLTEDAGLVASLKEGESTPLVPEDTAAEYRRRGAEALAASEAGVTQMAFGAEASLDKLGKIAGINKRFSDFTPQDKVQYLKHLMVSKAAQRDILKGEGPATQFFAGPLTEPEKPEEVAQPNLPIRQEVVAEQTDPFSFYLYGKAFHGLTHMVPGEATGFIRQGLKFGGDVAKDVTGVTLEGLGATAKGISEAAAKTSGLIPPVVTRGAIPPLLRSVVAKVPEVGAALGKKIQTIGEQVVGESLPTLPSAQVVRDITTLFPKMTVDVASGIAFDVGTAAVMASTPEEKQNLGIGFGFGLLGATRRGFRSVVSGQLISAREYGTPGRVSSTGFQENFEPAHNKAYDSLPTGEKLRINALRKFIKTAAPNADLFVIPGEMDRMNLLVREGFTPETANRYASQKGFHLRNYKGTGRNLIVADHVDTAPHEVRHAMEDVLGDDATSVLNGKVKAAYSAQEWENEAQRYSARLGWDRSSGERWQDFILKNTSGEAAVLRVLSDQVAEAWKKVGKPLKEDELEATVKRIWNSALDKAQQADPGADRSTLSPNAWRMILTPKSKAELADSYIAREISAETWDAVFKHTGPGMKDPKGLIPVFARIAANFVQGLGGEPLAGRSSQVGRLPLKFKAAEEVRKAVGERLPVEPKTIPMGTVKPAISVQKPPPVTPEEMQKESEQALQIAQEVSDTPPPGTDAQSPREILGSVAQNIAEGSAATYLYQGAKGEKVSSDPDARREVRRLEVENSRNLPDSLRELMARTGFPYRVVKTRKGAIQVLDWSPSLLASNAIRWAKALSKLPENHPDLQNFPFELDRAKGEFTEAGWLKLFDAAEKFSRNQLAGFTGAGGELVVPRELAREGITQPPQTGEAADPIGQNEADFINTLYSLRPPKTPRAGKTTPRNITAQVVSEATLPGRTELPAGEPRAPFAEPKYGVSEIKEVNPLRRRLEQALIDNSIPLPDTIEVVRRLNLDRIHSVFAEPVQPKVVGANVLTTQAGFQPVEERPEVRLGIPSFNRAELPGTSGLMMNFPRDSGRARYIDWLQETKGMTFTEAIKYADEQRQAATERGAEGQFQPQEKKELEVIGPDGKTYKARFDGYYDLRSMGKGILPAVTALEDLPGSLTKNSSGISKSLTDAGYKIVTELPPFIPEEGAQFQPRRRVMDEEHADEYRVIDEEYQTYTPAGEKKRFTQLAEDALSEDPEFLRRLNRIVSPDQARNQSNSEKLDSVLESPVNNEQIYFEDYVKDNHPELYDALRKSVSSGISREGFAVKKLIEAGFAGDETRRIQDDWSDFFRDVYAEDPALALWIDNNLHGGRESKMIESGDTQFQPRGEEKDVFETFSGGFRAALEQKNFALARQFIDRALESADFERTLAKKGDFSEFGDPEIEKRFESQTAEVAEMKKSLERSEKTPDELLDVTLARRVFDSGGKLKEAPKQSSMEGTGFKTHSELVEDFLGAKGKIFDKIGYTPSRYWKKSEVYGNEKWRVEAREFERLIARLADSVEPVETARAVAREMVQSGEAKQASSVFERLIEGMREIEIVKNDLRIASGFFGKRLPFSQMRRPEKGERGPIEFQPKEDEKPEIRLTDEATIAPPVRLNIPPQKREEAFFPPIEGGPTKDEFFGTRIAQPPVQAKDRTFEAGITRLQFQPGDKKEMEVTGPDGKKYRMRLEGTQDATAIGEGLVPVLTALENIPGVVEKDSTVHGPTLTEAGFTLPETAQFQPKRDTEISKIAEVYAKSSGIKLGEAPDKYVPYNRELGKELAAFYENSVHSPESPEVKKSYDALKKETLEQYKAITKAGYDLEPLESIESPYKHGGDVFRDLKQNKHMFFNTSVAFGHGTENRARQLMLEPSGIKDRGIDLTYNDIFRAVHDFFGHAMNQFSFGPRGEFNAWKEHSGMFSKEAQGALGAETIGQTAWTQLKPSLLTPEGSLIRPGEEGFVPRSQRPYAEQKNIILPEKLIEKAKAQFRPTEEKKDIEPVPYESETFDKELEKVKTGDSFGQTFDKKGNPWEPENPNVDIVTLVSRNILKSDLDRQQVEVVLKPYSGLLGNPNVVAGVFSMQDPTKVSVDLNVVVPQEFRDNTLRFAKANDQQAIWDAARGEAVPTGGSGETKLTTVDQMEKVIEPLIRGEDVNVNQLLLQDEKMGRPQFQPKKAAIVKEEKEQLKFVPTSFGSDSKAWILPSGKVEQLGAQWHHHWLDEHPEVQKKYGLKVPSFEGTDTEGVREAALKKGFGRVNFDTSRGHMTVEVRLKDWRKLKGKVQDLASRNIDGLDKMTVHLLNDTATKAVDSYTSNLFEYETGREKEQHLPFITEGEIRGGGTQFQPSENPRAIKTAAVKDDEGKVFTGLWHGEAIDKAESKGTFKRDEDGFPILEEGFVTNEGEFLSRQEAFERAAEIDQISESSQKSFKIGMPEGKGRLESWDFQRQRQFQPPQEEKITDLTETLPTTMWVSPAGELYSAKGGHATFVEEFLMTKEDFKSDLSSERIGLKKGWMRIAIESGAIYVEQRKKTAAQRRLIKDLAISQGKPVIDDSGHNLEVGEQREIQFQPPEQEQLFGGREVLSTKQLSEMTAKEIADHFPESVIPKKRDEKIPSNIVESPLYKSSADPVSAFADKLVEFAKQYEKHPVFQKGLKWYSEFVPMLKANFGKHSNLMAQLLAATSPQTNPEVNFGYALDALESYKMGRFDKILPKLGQAYQMIENGTWLSWYNKALKAGKIADPPREPTESSFLGAWIDEHKLKPTQTNGKLYGQHSLPVLQVLSGIWLEKNAGPKTANFVQNLLGTGHESTIDLWADRTVRRLGYEGFKDRWRILPQNATGVSDVDFRFSQEVFREAAKRLGILPDALQGGAWFAEKQFWSDNGWGQLNLGDYRTEIKKLPLLRQGIQHRLKATEKRKQSETGRQPEFKIEPRYSL